MARERKARVIESPQLEMTPMIDVVFQLLIFFIVTLKQEDILSHLDINRPAPDSAPPKEEVRDLLTIMVYDKGFVLQGRPVSIKALERQLIRIAKFSKNISVIIKCTGSSPHVYLMQLLDVCAKAELKNLSVFSM